MVGGDKIARRIGWMIFERGNTKSGDISRADLLPFLMPFGELRRSAFLWPGVTLAVFSAALLMFAALDGETGFFWCLAGLISLANLYLIYLWCGKKMPFLYLLMVAGLALALDAALSPLIIVAEGALPSVFAPGLIEELVKALPVVAVLAGGLLMSHRLQREYGLREPLDGIMLAAASATGFFIGLAALRHRRAIPAAVAVLIGFVLANLLHDLWDAMRFYGRPLAIISPTHEVVIAVVCFVVLGSLLAKAREVSPEREFLWPFGSLMPYRAPEVEPLPAMPAMPGDIWLMIGGRRLSLTETAHLTVRDIPCLTAPAADGLVAEVREHPDDATLLVLRNLSSNIWQAVLPDGAVRHVGPAGTVRLVAGTRLLFGTQAGVILVTSTEIGADPRARAEEEWC